MLTIDENAPVIVMAEITTFSPLETVWEVLTGLEQWPSWNPRVKRVSVGGQIGEGMSFRWRAGAATITSTVCHAERPAFLEWTGALPGIAATHVWRLVRHDSQTAIRTEESWDGIAARLLRRPLRAMLRKAVDEGLRRLKYEAERRTPEANA
jgi:hypothetical protein